MLCLKKITFVISAVCHSLFQWKQNLSMPAAILCHSAAEQTRRELQFAFQHVTSHDWFLVSVLFLSNCMCTNPQRIWEIQPLKGKVCAGMNSSKAMPYLCWTDAFSFSKPSKQWFGNEGFGVAALRHPFMPLQTHIISHLVSTRHSNSTRSC